MSGRILVVEDQRANLEMMAGLILVTSLDAQNESLLSIKRLQDEVKTWNARLEERVREQVVSMRRPSRRSVRAPTPSRWGRCSCAASSSRCRRSGSEL